MNSNELLKALKVIAEKKSIKIIKKNGLFQVKNSNNEILNSDLELSELHEFVIYVL